MSEELKSLPGDHWPRCKGMGCENHEGCDLVEACPNQAYLAGIAEERARWYAVFRRQLEELPPETSAWRLATGRKVTAKELLEMIDRDDPAVRMFVEDIYGAAARAVRVRADKE